MGFLAVQIHIISAPIAPFTHPMYPAGREIAGQAERFPEQGFFKLPALHRPLESQYLSESIISKKGEKIQLLKTRIHCWHCCDSQQYQRQSIIFTNASCANEHSQKSPDFSGKEKRSVSLLAELIQCTKVKAPPSLPLLLLLL